MGGSTILELTRKQYTLLINMVNASINNAASSGIPIGQEYYKDIDIIKQELYKELALDRKGEVNLEFDT